MYVFKLFRERVVAIASDIIADDYAGVEANLAPILVEVPRDPTHGDLATNAALVLSKPLKSKPRDIADKIAARLKEDADIKSLDVAGPGFINFTLHDAFWQRTLAAALKKAGAFAASDVGKGRKVNVEYVSANPTGPLHVGHCRGAVYGDALARLLAATGHDVTREYYINDAGGQIDVLAQSVLHRYREALGEVLGDLAEGLYPGAYLVPVGKMLAEKYGSSLLEKPQSELIAILKREAIDAMMDLIREDLATLNIHHDVFFSENTLHGENGAISQMLAELTARDLVYEGRLPPPKGQLPEDWEDREQTLFRAEQFGDDVDRALKKSDGSYTYFAADVAYFRSKYQRNFNEMIFVLGADHGGYVKRLQAVGSAISDGAATVTVRLCQLVKLFRNGEPVRMSKRAGEFVTLRDVVNEVGPDAVRFMMLYRRNDAPLDFDFDKVTEQSKDNPVFYVQYAHARANSVLRQAKEAFGEARFAAMMAESVHPDTGASECLYKLTDEAELSLLRKLAVFPEVIEEAALAHEPHRIAFYLYELAAAYHALWNRGKDLPHLRFIQQSDEELTTARLALINGIIWVLAEGLQYLGVSAPDEM